MDNVYFYTRKYGWEQPVIKYFKEKKLWNNVFVSKRFVEDESFYHPKCIKMHVPQALYDQLYAYLPQFIDMQSRMSELSAYDYREYNYHDYLNLFSLYCDVYYNFYREERISLLVMNRAPHLGFDLVAMAVARALEIRTLFLEQSHFPNRFYMYSDYYDYGDFSTSKGIFPHPEIRIERVYEKKLSYMEEEVLNTRQKWRRFYENNPLIRMLSQLTHKAYRGQAIYRFDLKKAFKRNKERYVQPVDFDTKFVYFGLHFQPEQTTSSWGGKYVDQLLALERLSEFIPDDVQIYVKENPIQTYMMRGELFYHRIQRIKKVVLVPNDTNTYDLIRNALFVSTITGTLAWEAITGGKNALIFGWGAWYKKMPGIFYYDDQPRYRDVLMTRFGHAELEKKVNDLANKTGKGVIFPIDYYFDLVPEYDEDKNSRFINRSIEKFLYG